MALCHLDECPGYSRCGGTADVRAESGSAALLPVRDCFCGK